jgi:hypothetical protein
MTPLVALAGAILLLAVTGCDKDRSSYEIVRAGDQTFLIEKATGHTRVIEGTSLIEVQPPPAVSHDASVNRAKTWPAQDIAALDNMKLVTRTKYRDGSLLYSVEATPFKGRLEKEFTAAPRTYLGQPTVFIDFYDSDGFSVGQPLELTVRGATRLVNDKGEANALSWRGTQEMSVEAYRSVAYQNFRWANFAE